MATSSPGFSLYLSFSEFFKDDANPRSDDSRNPLTDLRWLGTFPTPASIPTVVSYNSSLHCLSGGHVGAWSLSVLTASMTLHNAARCSSITRRITGDTSAVGITQWRNTSSHSASCVCLVLSQFVTGRFNRGMGKICPTGFRWERLDFKISARAPNGCGRRAWRTHRLKFIGLLNVHL